VDSYASAGPVEDFDRHSAEAVEAIRELESAIEAAMRAMVALAFNARHLARQMRRALLHGQRCTPALAEALSDDPGDAGNPPGRLISTFPIWPIGPPSGTAAPFRCSWAQTVLNIA
jgi:hypothetical protein